MEHPSNQLLEAVMIDYLLFLWHEMVGHPRPWHYVNASTFCGACGREVKTFRGKRM